MARLPWPVSIPARRPGAALHAGTSAPRAEWTASLPHLAALRSAAAWPHPGRARGGDRAAGVDCRVRDDLTELSRVRRGIDACVRSPDARGDTGGACAAGWPWTERRCRCRGQVALHVRELEQPSDARRRRLRGHGLGGGAVDALRTDTARRRPWGRGGAECERRRSELFADVVETIRLFAVDGGTDRRD